MITTTEITPSPALALFVRCYTYREFNTNGLDFIKPWHAEHKISMPFFFKAIPVKLVDTQTQKIIKTGKPTGLTGLCTKYNGEMTFNGSYAFFEIIFKPHGFHKIFNIPSHEIIDKIIWGEEIFKQDHQLLLEQLYYAKEVIEMADLVNEWLLQYLNKQKCVDYKDRITAAANLIIKKAGLISMNDLACYINMSTRSFERHFNEEIGISPKHLCCITRFNHALELKLRKPNIDWTSVAHQSGYFDQMHLIKDFKRFCGEAPASLLKHVPLLKENYTNRVNV